MSNDRNVEGLDVLLRQLTALDGSLTTGGHVPQAMRENMADLEVAGVALVYVDTHAAEQSAYNRVTATSDKIVGEVGFTAESADGFPYPIVLHEDMTLNPGPKTAQKPDYDGETPGPKYLERPLEKYAPKYRDNIAEALNRAIEGLRSR
jgi:hypothetical protein